MWRTGSQSVLTFTFFLFFFSWQNPKTISLLNWTPLHWSNSKAPGSNSTQFGPLHFHWEGINTWQIQWGWTEQAEADGEKKKMFSIQFKDGSLYHTCLPSILGLRKMKAIVFYMVFLQCDTNPNSKTWKIKISELIIVQTYWNHISSVYLPKKLQTDDTNQKS